MAVIWVAPLATKFPGRGGGGYLGSVLLGMCAGLSEPLPHYSLFCGQL